MTIGTFDLTDNTQISVRKDTRLHPKYSMGIFIHSNDFLPEINAYDAVEWEGAVQLAKWILKIDGELNGGN